MQRHVDRYATSQNKPPSAVGRRYLIDLMTLPSLSRATHVIDHKGMKEKPLGTFSRGDRVVGLQYPDRVHVTLAG